MIVGSNFALQTDRPRTAGFCLSPTHFPCPACASLFLKASQSEAKSKRSSAPVGLSVVMNAATFSGVTLAGSLRPWRWYSVMAKRR